MRLICKNKVSDKDIKGVIANPLSVCGSDKIFKSLIFNGTEVSVGNVFQFKNGINSVCCKGNEICIGCNNGEVFYRRGEGEFILAYRHKGNVCSIDVNNETIFSGSWDNNAILYKIGSDVFDGCLAHPGSVWSSQIISEKRVITGCADGVVRIYEFNDGRWFVKNEIRYQNGPVRGILLAKEMKGNCNDRNNGYNENGNPIKTIIYTIDNNGGVFKIGMDGKLLRSRYLDEPIYCICQYKDFIIVGGEQGVLFKLNGNLEIIERVKLKTHAIWAICADDNNLYIGSGNGILYVLRDNKTELNKEEEIYSNKQGNSNREEIYNNNQEINLNRELDMKKTGINNNMIDKYEEYDEDSNSKDNKIENGEFTSDGIRYKVVDGNIYVEQNNEWTLLGECSAKFDHTFTINLGNKDFTLSFNDKDNICEVAREFLHKNKLGLEYYEEIVDFIRKNFKKNTLYRRYSKINISGIKRTVGNHHPIIKYLEKIIAGDPVSTILTLPFNIYEIEQIIFNGIYTNQTKERLPFFVVLDISRYLLSQGFNIDLAFLFSSNITNKKEAKAFLNLMTNLVIEPPFNLEPLDEKLFYIKDKGWITSDDMADYYENKKISADKK